MASKAFDFAALVAAIRQADAVLAEQAARAVNVSLTLRNWFIGFYIAEFELQGADRSTYGDKLLAELSSALRAQGVSNSGRRQLYGYLAFYRAYPQIMRTASALSAGVQAAPLLAEKVRTLSAQILQNLLPWRLWQELKPPICKNLATIIFQWRKQNDGAA